MHEDKIVAIRDLAANIGHIRIAYSEFAMGDRLYVSGLPYAVTEDQLQDLFSEHGTVASARIVTDRFSGRSRGFGFVEMGSEAEAQAAMEALNGTELQGRVLKVNEAHERRPREG